MATCNLKRLSTLSENSEVGDNRPLSPDGCNRSIKSFSSTSTLDSIALESSNISNAPPLPARVVINVLELRKWPKDSKAPGWGVTLRGTMSELAKGVKIYTCHIETVHESGAAKVAGLREGDQIVSVDGVQVKNKEHKDIVKIFQSHVKLTLAVLPARFNSCSQVRIINSNKLALEFVWALMRHLQTLEIINVNIGKIVYDLDLSVLLCLKSLSINHCSIAHLSVFKGLNNLLTLESLSFAHNLLTSQAILSENFYLMKNLKKLDLSRNALNSIPECICNIRSLEILILVDNNITEIPYDFNKLENLHTLCLDGNLLREVDPELRIMKSIEKLTISNNSLECESEVVKLNEFLITCIEGNPFCNSGLSRNEPSLRRTLSVRGQLFAPKHRKSLEWDSCMTEFEYDQTQ